MANRVLLITSDEPFREQALPTLRGAGVAVDFAGDGEAGMVLHVRSPYPVVVLPAALPRMGARAFLDAAVQANPEVQLLFLCADEGAGLALLEAGAADLLPWPCPAGRLLAAVQRALELVRLAAQVAELKARFEPADEALIFSSPAMKAVVGLVDRVADADVPVLITGEAGTGKELVAQRLHRRSVRGSGPFVAVNCAAIPSEVLERELFGAAGDAVPGGPKKGKFELADGGTIYLDEVGDIPLELQPRVLKVVQERLVEPMGGGRPVRVNLRVVAATARDLKLAVGERKFLDALYFRLSIFPLTLPPLRKRREDIALLVERFLRVYGGDRKLSVSPALMNALEEYSWPGNARELENLIQRLALMSEADQLTPDLLPERMLPTGEGKRLVGEECVALPRDGVALAEVERQVVMWALGKNGGDLARTARFLRLTRAKLKKYVEKESIVTK